MIGSIGARRPSRVSRRGSSPNVHPGHSILIHASKHKKGQTLLNPTLLEDFHYDEDQKNDGAEAKHHAQTDDQANSPSIQVSTISVIGGVQQQRLRLSATNGSSATARIGRASESKLQERTGESYRTHDQQPASNDSNKGESPLSVESALYSTHQDQHNNQYTKKDNNNQKDNSNSANKSEPHSSNKTAELADFAASNRQRKRSIPGGGYLTQHRRSVASAARLSVADIAAAAQQSQLSHPLQRRRRAVEASDQKACVLLHSKLKGMKLEDIAPSSRVKRNKKSEIL